MGNEYQIQTGGGLEGWGFAWLESVAPVGGVQQEEEALSQHFFAKFQKPFFAVILV